MPRVYKKKPGSRSYRNYSNEQLDQCLTEVLDGKISATAAAKKYKIAKGTIINKIHGRKWLKVGGQTALSSNEELEFANNLTTCAEWGFPLTKHDLRLLVKHYLDRQGKTVKQFNNNCPGEDWASSFMQRHKAALSQRLGNNIKRSRASVDHNMLGTFHDELSRSLEGLSPEAIFNYDESNLSDDPGKKLMIFKRGIKYPDNVTNFSKSAVSIMLCISASGVCLPPYVVYKANNIWDTWRIGGPKGKPFCSNKCCSRGSRYNRSNHGWFDAVCFVDWFKMCFLPHALEIPGAKALLGDNLSSHFTPEVLNLCKEHNIRFICLPPNATHLCQPLDISFFGPMKKAWRKILHDWKQINVKSSSVNKSIFPRLLKQLFDDLAPTMCQNAQSGFRTSGIYPLSKEKLLSKVPRIINQEENENVNNSNVSDTFLQFLQEQRNPNKRMVVNQTRKKLNVIPGRSVAADDTPSNDEDEEDRMTSVIAASAVKRKIMQESSSELSSDLEEEEHEENDENNVPKETVADFTKTDFAVGSWVLVKYETKKTRKHFIGQVLSLSEDDMSIKFLKRTNGGKFVWPEVEDIDNIQYTSVITILPPPQIERRGHHVFPKSALIDFYK